MTQEQEEQQKHHEYTRLIEDMGLVRAVDYLLGQKSASHTATLLEEIEGMKGVNERVPLVEIKDPTIAYNQALEDIKSLIQEK